MNTRLIWKGQRKNSISIYVNLPLPKRLKYPFKSNDLLIILANISK